MIRTQGLNHLTLRIANLDRSLAFYCNVLGFALRHRGRSDAYLESGALWLTLLERPVESGSERTVGLDHWALTVADDEFNAAVAELQQHQVPIVKGPLTRGRGRSVYFTDPDGLVLELHTSNLDERMIDWR